MLPSKSQASAAKTASACGCEGPSQGAGREDKIAAIGIRVRRWVSLHGISLNVDPDLSHFAGIVPCGVAEARFGVTSLRDLGRAATLAEVDAALRDAFEAVFGPVRSDILRLPEVAVPCCATHLSPVSSLATPRF